jgi:hypothetical protein
MEFKICIIEVLHNLSSMRNTITSRSTGSTTREVNTLPVNSLSMFFYREVYYFEFVQILHHDSSFDF